MKECSMSRFMKGQLVKLAFGPWKITRVKDKLILQIENSGKDGFVLMAGGDKNQPVLVFGK